MRATVPTMTVSLKNVLHKTKWINPSAGRSIDRDLYIAVTNWRFRYYIFVTEKNRCPPSHSRINLFIASAVAIPAPHVLLCRSEEPRTRPSGWDHPGTHAFNGDDAISH